jgi:hypothetical protein
MKQQNIKKSNTINDTFIQRNQCSRGKPLAEQRSIPSSRAEIYSNNTQDKDLSCLLLLFIRILSSKEPSRNIFLEVEASIRSSYIDLFTFIKYDF